MFLLKRKNRKVGPEGNRTESSKISKSYWIRFHLLRDEENSITSIVDKRWFVDAIVLVNLAKNLLSLWFGWSAKAFQKYSGDFFASFDSEPIWLYLNAASVVVFLQTFLIPFLCRKHLEHQWLSGFFDQKTNGSLLEKDLLRRYQKFSKFLFRITDLAIKVSPFVVAGSFCIARILFEFNKESIVLSVAWSAIYFLGLRTGAGRVFVPPLFFILFCLRTSLGFRQLSSRIRRLGEFNPRLRPLANWIDKKVLSANECQNGIFEEIRSCNRLYRQVTAIFIPVVAFTMLSLTFGIQNTEKFGEKVFLGYIGLFAFLIVIVYYLAAGMVNRAVKRCFVAWHYSLCRVSLGEADESRKQRRFLLPLKQQLKLLASLEYMSSKRMRVGFSCLHWFSFSNFSLIKVTLFCI